MISLEMPYAHLLHDHCMTTSQAKDSSIASGSAFLQYLGARDGNFGVGDWTTAVPSATLLIDGNVFSMCPICRLKW